MRYVAIIAFLVATVAVHSQPQTPFSKGVNLTNWFQVSSAREIQFTRFTRKDLERIKSLGCDVIRLPINLHAMTNGAPDYTLDPLFLTFLDKVVTWSEELDIHLILDNHTFDPAVSTSTSVGGTLVKVWTQMADHYKNRSDKLYYEVLNEPHGISDADWGVIQQNVINAIRSKDIKHFIIVGAAEWNSYNNLNNLPAYTDTKLIYTFHFYDPFLFTHQGASWTDPSMAPLAGMPFPFGAAAMPTFPNTLKGTWIESAFNNYSNDGTVAKVKSLIDIAVNFRAQRNVFVFCGEFGVYIPNSDNTQRVSWYKTVKEYFDVKKISWTMWDYTGGFGLFEKGSNELFDYDLNVPFLESLGLNVPAQLNYVRKPSTKGFSIYSDYIGEGMVDGSYGANAVKNLYDQTSPQTGDYCLYWTGTDQYGVVGFDFQPNVDLSLLKSHDHKLKFWVKANAVAKIDIRFLDSKEGDTDRPWRMGKTIEQILGDNAWKLIEISLKDFEEKGAWDNAFYPPEGKFDWTSVDRFEIVAEYHNLNGIKLWFDDIEISGQEIIVQPEPEPEPEPVTSIYDHEGIHTLNVSPNPLADQAAINFEMVKYGDARIYILSTTGEEISSINAVGLSPGKHHVVWDGKDRQGEALKPGFYILKLKTNHATAVKKFVKVTR